MANEIKKIASELQLTNSKEVVKIAGVLRRLKNVFKRMVDKDYDSAVEKLNSESLLVKAISNQLHKKIDLLLSSIKDGDMEGYEKYLVEVKELSAGLISEIGVVNNTVVQNTAAPANLTPSSEEDEEPISSARPYDVDQWKENPKKIREKVEHSIKKHHPGLDIPMGSVMKPMAELPIFKDSQIVFTESSVRTLINDLVTKLESTGIDPDQLEKIITSKLDYVKLELASAINAGMLVENIVANPDQKKTVKFRNPGQMHLKVTTRPMEIPGIGEHLTATVLLTDLRWTKTYPEQNGPNKLSFRKLVNLKFAKKANLRLEGLKALAFVPAAVNQQLPYQVTNLSETEFANVLAEGYKKAFGTYPTLEVLGAAWAQSVLESGRPVKLPNNNIGNIKATKDWIAQGNLFFVKDTVEIDANHKSYVEKGTKWRAYQTPTDGGAGYWKFLGGRYKDAIDWMAAGDPVSASVVLGEKGYYTANIQKYSSAVGKLYSSFIKNIAPSLPNLTSSPKPPPAAQKPIVKEWRNSPTPAKAAPAPTPVDEVDNLISNLLAAGPVERLVKEAIMSEKMPTANVLITIGNLSKYSVRYKFATTLQKSLKEILGGDVSIHSDDEKLEVQCITPGTTYLVASAVHELSNHIAKIIENKTDCRLVYQVIPDSLSQFFRK